MDLTERIIFFGLGLGVGFIFGYIVRTLRDIKEKVDDMDRIVHDDHEKNEMGFMRYPIVADLVMLLILAIVVYAAVQSQLASNKVSQQVVANKEQVHQFQVDRCKGGEDNRDVQRELVEAIFSLATGSVSDNPNLDKLTPLEVRQYNAYIARVNDFRTGMYAKIKPTEECLSYVTDDNVKPPTDPFPSIPAPKESR